MTLYQLDTIPQVVMSCRTFRPIEGDADVFSQTLRSEELPVTDCLYEW